MGRLFPADPPPFYRVPFGYHLIDPIKQSLTDAGFTDLAVAVLHITKEIEDLAAFARGLVHGNPLVDQIRARGDLDPDRVVEAVAEAMRSAFGMERPRMDLQTIVFEARKG